jgi:hypothetical protein
VLARLGSLVEVVGKKDRVTAAAEAALTSPDGALLCKLPSVNAHLSYFRADHTHLCFEASSGRGPSGALCPSLMDRRRPLRFALLSMDIGGREAEVTLDALRGFALSGALVFVRWNFLRGMRPSASARSVNTLFRAPPICKDPPTTEAYRPSHWSPPPNCSLVWGARCPWYGQLASRAG